MLERRTITVLSRDVYTLPPNILAIRVVSGGAWISDLRENRRLRCGEHFALPRHHKAVAVTAEGSKPLVMELELAR